MPEDEPDDRSDGDEAPPARRSVFSSIFTPRSSGGLTDPEVREKMRTLDPQERRLGIIAVPLALLVTLFTLAAKTTVLTLYPARGTPKSCSYLLRNLHIHGAYLDKSGVCEVPVLKHPSDATLIFSLGLVLTALLAYGVWRSLRTLVIFVGLFIGLFAGIPGVLFLFYAGWLVLRSWRLQRYGAKDAATARKASMDRSVERREQRRAAKADGGATTATKSSIQPSKRYTPKAKPRRR